MAHPLEERTHLISALIAALGSTTELADVLEDLAQTGDAGLCIRNNLRLTNALETDCRRLVMLSKEYTNGLSNLQSVLQQHLHRKAAWPALKQALIAYRSAVETSVSPSSETTSQSVYVSYAWGDSSPEWQRRGQLVDRLCESIISAGITVLIDREQVKPGDRISSFLNAIASGDVVIIILSHQYLESEYCVYELNGIWKQASQDPDRFLQRVIPLTFPDTNLKATEDLFTKSQFWIQRWKALKQQIIEDVDTTGVEVFAKCKDIQEFAQQLGNILALLNDKCEPRDFDRQAQEGFREVIDQIRAVRTN